VPCRERDLRTGAERRAFLTDPSHKHVFHFTPKHGSWLNQVELWFGTLAKRWLKRGDFTSVEEFITRLQTQGDCTISYDPKSTFSR
jgi:transposase